AMGKETGQGAPEERGGRRRKGSAVKASPLAWPLIAMIRVYQLTFSPLIGGSCRYRPTCSNYAIEALRKHGALKGSWLAARRLSRCHPWGGSGEDPVPGGRRN